MNMFQHLLVAVRAGDLQHFRVHFADLIHLRAQAAGDNHFAVFRQGFTNGFQRLLDRAVDEPAGVDDHHVGVVVAWHHVIAFSAKFSQDAFGVHQVLRAAQGDKADFRRVRNIAHRLKIHQLWSYQGGILQRIAGDLYTLDGAVEAGNRCNIVKNVNQLSFIDLRHYIVQKMTLCLIR